MNGLRKARFIHSHNPKYIEGSKYNGFSILMSPSRDSCCVVVAITLCVKADAFCRRDARSALIAKEKVTVPVVKLPEMLARLQAKAENWKFDKLEKDSQQYEANQWAWVWKYFL